MGIAVICCGPAPPPVEKVVSMIEIPVESTLVDTILSAMVNSNVTSVEFHKEPFGIKLIVKCGDCNMQEVTYIDQDLITGHGSVDRGASFAIVGCVHRLCTEFDK